MSIQALAWARTVTTGTSNRKLVLWVLADYADEAWSCYPGQKRIAAETELGERTVRRVLAELETAGLITRQERRRDDGYRTSDRIVLQPGAISPANPAADPEPHRPTTTVSPANPAGQESSGDPSVEVEGARSESQPLLLTEGQVAAATADSTFDRFWDAWPTRNGRKLGRRQARQKWDHLDTAQRTLALTGAVNYADASGRRLAGAMDAYRWLRDQLWDDWQAPIPANVTRAAGRGTGPPATRQVMTDRGVTGRWTPTGQR